MEGSLTLGTLVAFQSLAHRVQRPDREPRRARRDAPGDGGQPRQRRRRAALPGRARAAATVEARCRRGSAGALELRGVTFGYSPLAPPVVEDLSLTMRPGDRVALVGPSGCGKCTIARLVCGLYQPWERRDPSRRDPARRDPARDPRRVAGARRPGHRPVRGDRPRHARAVGSDACPRPRSSPAARDATIHDDIVRRPGGYDRVIEEAGRDWSGGQRQRLEIARALAGDPALARARRGDERARPARGAPDRRAPARPGLHLPDRRPPPEHDPRLRRDRGARPGQGRAARDRTTS